VLDETAFHQAIEHAMYGALREFNAARNLGDAKVRGVVRERQQDLRDAFDSPGGGGFGVMATATRLQVRQLIVALFG
jgi:hypothetical protein